MANNRPPTQTTPSPGSHPRAAWEARWAAHGWPRQPGVVSGALLGVILSILLIGTTACGATTPPANTSPNRVVFDETVAANLVTKPVILTGSQQILAWTCSPAGGATLLISMGAAGSDPADAQPIFKGMCAMGGTSGSQTLHMPPGSYFLQFLPGGSWHIVLTDIDYSASTATAIARIPIPTATPDPTPPPFSPAVSYQSAWGSHAITATYDMDLDSTHTFIPTAISPDGTMLLGNENILPSNTDDLTVQGGYYDLATKRFTAIGVSDGGEPVQCCMSDGRYLVIGDSDAPGETCGACHERYWSYDLWTGRLRLVASGRTYQGLGAVGLSHGLLILQGGSQVLVANLATETIAPLTAAPSDSWVDAAAFSWPYVIYELVGSTDTPTGFGVRNLATNQDRQLPSLKALISSHAPNDTGSQISYTVVGDSLIVALVTEQTATQTNSYGEAGTTAFYALEHVLSGGTGVTLLGSFTSEGSPGYAVANNTLYVSVLSGQVTGSFGGVQNIGWTTLYAIGQVTSGGTSPSIVATFSGDALDLVGANSRVIACDAGVWDASEQQLESVPVFWDIVSQTFVSFAEVTGNVFPQLPSFEGNGYGIVISLVGNDLAVVQPSETGERVLFLNTSTLPTTG